MGKHDKTTPDSYAESRIERLEKQLEEKDKQIAFDAETIKQLQTEVSKYNRWMSELQANAQDEANALRAEIDRRDEAIIRLVVQ